MNKFQNVCKTKTGQLKGILQKVQDLKRINNSLQKHLAPELAPHCTVANFRNGALILAVDNASWATHLRYAIPDLLSKLRKEENLYSLRSIKQYIPASDLHESVVPENNLSISHSGVSALLQLAENTEDDALKASLLRLAKNGG